MLNFFKVYCRLELLTLRELREHFLGMKIISHTAHFITIPTVICKSLIPSKSSLCSSFPLLFWNILYTSSPFQDATLVHMLLFVMFLKLFSGRLVSQPVLFHIMRESGSFFQTVLLYLWTCFYILIWSQELDLNSFYKSRGRYSGPQLLIFASHQKKIADMWLRLAG